jgi:hypothetical protein
MKILGPDPAGIKPDAGRGVPKLENFCEKTPVVQVNQPYRPRSDRVCVDLTGVLDRSFQIARIFVSVRNPDLSYPTCQSVSDKLNALVIARLEPKSGLPDFGTYQMIEIGSIRFRLAI